MRHVRPRPAARHRAPPPEERSLTTSEPRFVGSFPRADAPLDPPLPEIAFLGRSNVGKSSLLNALVGRRIAKTSGTPGKTRAFNVFLITDLGAGARGLGGDTPGPTPQAPGPMYFLDLPGYGYARAGKSQRADFKRLLRYALRRERLRGIVWLLDIRHDPSAEDWTMHEQLVEQEAGVLAALTKADKLSRSQQAARLRELTEALELPEDQLVLTSATTGDGIPELREAIAALISKGD